MQTIAVGLDGVMFDAVEMTPNLFGGMDTVVQVRDEARDCPLEVDVVLPERVVGIDQECLGLAASHGGRNGGRGHRLIISRLWGRGYLQAEVMPRLGDVFGGSQCEKL